MKKFFFGGASGGGEAYPGAVGAEGIAQSQGLESGVGGIVFTQQFGIVCHAEEVAVHTFAGIAYDACLSGVFIAFEVQLLRSDGNRLVVGTVTETVGESILPFFFGAGEDVDVQ
ncbi:hypothetical protein [Bacteroides sp.]|uniref:hypothetical protein n=1 Tax=Bacteroides sp. TaxID=29523 RepID=UPI003A925A0A